MIFAYARISTHKETQKTDRRLHLLRKYAAVNHFEIDEIVEEVMSGKDIDRSKYNVLKAKMRQGDILIITDIDRLGRNADQVIIEFKKLKADGIKVVVLDTLYLNAWNTVQDDSMYNIVDSLITLKAHIAQHEREKLVERINAGLAAAK